ncbi:hypothetical protein ACFPN7_01840 [Amycolatopsis halotolerans]|uniref:hypothetical protein n=1 Tax=Amycolatopsis halotolerans TaxID=330083 RepID=UPI0036065BDF
MSGGLVAGYRRAPGERLSTGSGTAHRPWGARTARRWHDERGTDLSWNSSNGLERRNTSPVKDSSPWPR